MDVYACLLAFMLYIHVCLARSRFLLCFKPFVGLCLSVFGATCLCGCIHPSYGLFGCNHLWDTSPWCWFAWCIPLSAPCNVMLDLLALCPHLDLFVSLHLCTLAYMFMHESLCLLVLSSLIPTISCGFTLVLDTRDPESFIGILLGGTCVIHTPVNTLWLLNHPSQRRFRAFHLSVSVREYMDMEEVCCTLGVWLESESILKKLPRVSEVVTNHWVFLRCDWSPDFIWFYYWS